MKRTFSHGYVLGPIDEDLHDPLTCERKKELEKAEKKKRIEVFFIERRESLT